MRRGSTAQSRELRAEFRRPTGSRATQPARAAPARTHCRLRGMRAAGGDPPGVTDAPHSLGFAAHRRPVTRVSARLPAPTEAELLRMPRNRPVLICENINVDSAGAVVEFAVGCYPTPRVQPVLPGPLHAGPSAHCVPV